MSDFCKQCTDQLNPNENLPSDFVGLTTQEKYVGVLCEGCGPIAIDINGTCQGGCLKPSHSPSKANA